MDVKSLMYKVIGCSYEYGFSLSVKNTKFLKIFKNPHYCKALTINSRTKVQVNEFIYTVINSMTHNIN